VFPRVLPQVLGVALLSCLAVWGLRNEGIHLPSGATVPLARALARDAVALLNDGVAPGGPVKGREEARRLAHRSIAFAYALAGALRGSDESESASGAPRCPSRRRCSCTAPRTCSV
jgi:ion channel-forming bestrophin family protein